MKIAIGSDHAGFRLKEYLILQLKGKGIAYEDKGTFSEESTDYPEFAHTVSRAVADKKCDLGILICGSANGVAMSANKHKEIRCAIAWEAELAGLARAHNDANIIALPARFISEALGWEITSKFLDTEFEGGRHARRVNQIAC